MGERESEQELVARAAAGDQLALERLLLACHDRLVAHLTRELPADLRGVVSAEDVLQEAYVVAFRQVDTFEPRGADAFYHWLRAIAKHRLFDAIKGERAAKRGGRRTPVEAQPGTAASSVVELLELLNVHERTPSRSVARHEAVAALQVAFAGLKDDYREALRLRHIEGLSVAETAARMSRTERAVHMLCHRALQRLHQAMGRSSQYLTRK
ncbi:MAG TPA: sigma-70 family RNA polymerase sigma factor [Phycisphaerae bacterium]|nr:sigma-70 family RNA polymerase sigma factor [Phycisphaerae bacterium]